MLDEVDAPLDDANVERFCKMLDQMTEMSGTRFLVITHHALTMCRMDRLFGVTMAERGISQLVSVTLAEAEKVAAGNNSARPGAAAHFAAPAKTLFYDQMLAAICLS